MAKRGAQRTKSRRYFVEDKDGKSLPVTATRVEVTPGGALCIYTLDPNGGETEVLAWAFAPFDWVRLRLSSVVELRPPEE
jgi:hypothetical protein